jgi:hypothetical protein
MIRWVEFKKRILVYAWIISLLWLPSCSGFLQAVQIGAQETPGSGEHTPSRALKISIGQEGIYQLSAEDLAMAGFSQDFGNGSKLNLYSQWGELPMWSQGQGENLVLRFYGIPYKSVYTQANVYWLTMGDDQTLHDMLTAQRKKEIPDHKNPTWKVPTPNNSFFERVVAEQNLRYVPQARGHEHWFWKTLSAPQSEDFGIETSHPASGGQAILQLDVWGSTEAAASPDHHVSIFINDKKVADESWDGQGSHQIEVEFASDGLNEGENVVTVDAPGDTGVAVDLVQIDKISLYYPRMGIAQNDRMLIPVFPGNIDLSGFTSAPQVYDITDIQNARLVQDELDLAKPMQGENGHSYLIVGSQGYLSPLSISPWGDQPKLRTSDRGADYLAIGPSHLLESIKPLLDLREEQDISTAAIPSEAIYDQFGYGMPEPEGIRDFIRYAANHWQPLPHYILLVGDATYDPKRFVSSQEANQLPTYLVETVYGGETASDIPFVQLEQEGDTGDPWPDLAIGRIPARTQDQVSTLVQKILQYENSLSAGGTGNKVLAVADGQEAYFKTDAQAFLDLFSQKSQTELYAPPRGVQDASSTIQGYFNQGNHIIAYFGHGSVNMWGKDQLFNTQDVASLSNEKSLPVVLNFTCLTGLFTHPTVESLSEALLWQPNGGAVAALAPTSLTLPTDQSFLTRPLVEGMLTNPEARLGDILFSARRQVPQDSPGTRDVMETFLLLGDPALRLTAP